MENDTAIDAINGLVNVLAVTVLGLIVIFFIVFSGGCGYQTLPASVNQNNTPTELGESTNPPLNESVIDSSSDTGLDINDAITAAAAVAGTAVVAKTVKDVVEANANKEVAKAQIKADAMAKDEARKRRRIKRNSRRRRRK